MAATSQAPLSSHFTPSLKHAFAGPLKKNKLPSSTKSEKARKSAQIIDADPWSTRTENRLSSLLEPISHTSFFQTLRLIKAPAKAIRFFNWAKDSGFKHTSQSYFSMLEILGRARNLNHARKFLLSIPKKSDYTVELDDKFFNSLIRSYGEAGLFQESLRVFGVMKEMGVFPSAVTFNSLFVLLFKRGRVGMVYGLYDEMLKSFGVKPDLCTFNVLIRGLCMNSRLDDAFRMFNEMERSGIEADLITYNTIVDGLCRAGKVEAAQNVVNGMLKKGNEKLRPNVVSYTTLIRGYCGKGKTEEALNVFNDMVRRGVKPTDVTFNTIVKGLCDFRKFDALKDILGENCGFVPDTCTFNTIIHSHCEREDLSEALKVFDTMVALKLKRDSATYSVLIRALCKRRDFDRAVELLDDLLEDEILSHGDDKCTPLSASYNPIFEYLCANGETKKADRLFKQLMKRGKADPNAYETLILGHCKEGNSEDGHKLLLSMLRRDFSPGVKVYESLIGGLLQRQNPKLACEALENMLRSSHIPRTSLFHRVLMALIEKRSPNLSANLMVLMLNKEIRPNMNLSTDTVKLLLDRGLKKQAFELLRNICSKGYVINVEEAIVYLLGKNSKLLEAFELLMFGLKNEQKISIGTCSEVLGSLCKVHRLSEAFDLYYELLEKDFRVPSITLEELRRALEADGKVKEAEFVAKRMANSS